jgi:hypothetical protein
MDAERTMEMDTVSLFPLRERDERLRLPALSFLDLDLLRLDLVRLGLDLERLDLDLLRRT